MKGLIIKKPWTDLILSGTKTWEIRGSNTKIRGRIEIIESGTGTIVGSVELVASIPLSKIKYQLSKKHHRVENTSLVRYKNIYAWILKNPIKYKVPKKYVHKKGCIIWVNL